MTSPATRGGGSAAAVVCLVAGLLSLPVMFVGETSFVPSVLLSLLALGCAAYVFLEQDGPSKALMAGLGVVGALAGPALVLLGFVLQG
ncbi:MAG TPA: hypothetical protein VFR07_02110 [Mycobacteriales bacterium]|nr:hypothetical protein [Mycobacteriales bacterium]